MHSRLRACMHGTAAALLMVAATQQSSSAQTPDRVEIARALEAVKADPDLTPARTVRTLRWVNKSDPLPASPPSSFQWLLQLIGWIAQSARIMIWVAVALLTGLLAIFLLRLIRERSPTLRSSPKVIPTHVQDLDIRPESLPDNIGAAARTLWDSGDHRAALSLLYRGLLSRLVHVHNIPIRHSSTEGDTLQLTAAGLEAHKREYVTRLIRIWEHAVYGGKQPQTSALHGLCAEFAPALDAV